MSAGRPKISEYERACRKAKRLRLSYDELLCVVDKDPFGPAKSGVGRPPVSYFSRLARVITDLSCTLDIIRRLEKEQNLPPITDLKRQVIDPSIDGDAKVGRPKASELDRIAYAIRRQESRRKRVLSGEETSPPKRTKAGRRRLSISQKVALIDQRIEDLRRQYERRHAELTDPEREELRLRRLQRLASRLRQSITEKGLTSELEKARKKIATPKDGDIAALLSIEEEISVLKQFC